MNVFDLFDDATRPKAAAIPGATPEHRLIGKKLASIHAMHISALDETRAVILLIEKGEAHPEELMPQIEANELMRNYRRFGNLCGRECQFLEFHHTSEDWEIFPNIAAAGNASLTKVIDRLAEEHLVIHQLLETLAANVLEMRENPGPVSFHQTRETFLVVYRAVISHFGYEQTELEEALGFFGAPL